MTEYYYLKAFVDNNDKHYYKTDPDNNSERQQILVDVKSMIVCYDNSQLWVTRHAENTNIGGNILFNRIVI